MRYRIFTQTPDGNFDPQRLAHNARLFFRSKVEVLEQEPRRIRLRLQGELTETPVELTLEKRQVEPEDRKDVSDAERRGNATGMGALAARCRYLWEVSVPDDVPSSAALALCAATASVALGPVLPPDGSTLLGARDAIERATGSQRLEKARPAG